MSQNLDEYRVPIPEGSEPEEQPPDKGYKFLWIAILLIILIGLGIGAVLFFQRGGSDEVATMEEEPVQSTPIDEPLVEEVEPTPQNQDINRIVFIDPESRVATINRDGSDTRVLTELGRFYRFPAWSPGGNLIAAIGDDFEESGVYVLIDHPDSASRQLYAEQEDVPIYLFWTPDGLQVSFIAQHPDGLALHLAPADGTSGSRILATGRGSFFWNWLPDNQQAFIHTGFTAREGDITKLAFVPVDSESEENKVFQNGFFQTPGISNDGTYISYGDVDPTGRRWLTVWNIDDDDQERLVGHNGVAAMGWNPTKPQLAYTSPSSEAASFYGPLRLLDIETGDNRLLIPAVVIAFFWSPDGESIAFLTLNRIEEPEEGQPGADPTQGESQTIQTEMKIFLDSWVLNLNEEDPRPLITFEPTDVFLNQFLPFFDQYALSHRLWSPDSTALVLPMKDDERQDVLVVVPVHGDDPLVIADGEIAFWNQQ